MQLAPQVLRSLYRSRRFSFAVIATLGIGVGAGASGVALIDQLLLRAPPRVADAGHVRRMTLLERPQANRQFTSRSLAWVDYDAVKRSTKTLTGVAAYFPMTRSLGRGAEAHSIAVTNATASYFTVLGVRPALGRFFVPEEDLDTGLEQPCVASHAFWRRELGGVPSAVGRQLRVGTVSCTVVGVAPEGFGGVDLGAPDLWLPMRAGIGELFGPDSELWTTDRSHWVRIIARLRDGVEETAAAEDASRAYRGYTARGRDPHLTARVRWEPLVTGHLVGSSRVEVSALVVAGSMVLLMLIVINLVNLFLVREMGRARESAVRLALGGSRWNLFAHRALESAVLALLAGAFGLVIATWLGPALRAILLGHVGFTTASVTGRVALVTLAVALLTGLAIAVVSTMRLGTADPAALLRAAGSSRSGTTRQRHVARLGLVGAQAMLSAALMVASIAFVRSFQRASDVDLGFDRKGVVVGQLLLEGGDDLPTAKRDIYRLAHERAAALPGVQSASLGYMTPWWNNRGEAVSIPGRETLPPVPLYTVPIFDAVTPDYLTTMRLRLRAGRWFAESDARGAAPVIVINEALARLYWPGVQPIGQCLRVGDSSQPCREVIGVVQNARFTGELSSEPVATYYLPLAQSDAFAFTPRLFVRTSGNPEVMVTPLRRMLQSLASGLPAATVFPLEQRFEPLVAPWRLGSYAFTGLGLLATIVGTLGLFSVLTYVVAERRREFAIRAAIGATAWQITVPVLRQGVVTIVAGVAAGVLIAVAVSRWLQPLLFHTTLTEPGAVGGVLLASLSIAIAASLHPARAAGTHDPMEALREE